MTPSLNNFTLFYSNLDFFVFFRTLSQIIIVLERYFGNTWYIICCMKEQVLWDDPVCSWYHHVVIVWKLISSVHWQVSSVTLRVLSLTKEILSSKRSDALSRNEAVADILNKGENDVDDMLLVSDFKDEVSQPKWKLRWW